MNIEIKNLKKNYGKQVIFNDLNLTITSGKMTGIYGESGCGKTTLLDIIGLLEPYQSGEVLYDGKSIKGKRKIRRVLQNKIGFVFQDYGLVPNETVKQNILLVKKIEKDKKRNKHIAKVFDQLNLPIEFLNKKVYELSGGEQQRVTIAKIVLKNPDLILADEPTASLDTDNKQIVMNFLRQYVEEGKTVVIVSHDMDIVNQADEIIDLSKLKV